VLASTRTLELQDAVAHQAELAVVLRARTDFFMLNAPPASPQFVTVASGADASRCQRIGVSLDTVNASVPVLAKSIVPSGATPLTESVNRIHALLAPLAARMRESGEQATVVIATDGLPNRPAASA